MDKLMIDVPVPIKTPRLTLRPPQAGDGKAMFEAKQESLKELKPWMLWAHHPQDVELDEAMSRQKYVDFLTREELMLFAFDENNKLVASTGLHRFDWALKRFEIGYWVRSSETGKGYATEITVALARYAFKALKANRVEIFHDAGNKASAKVIEKAKVPFEGILRNGILGTDDKPADKHMYAYISIDEVPELDVSW